MAVIARRGCRVLRPRHARACAGAVRRRVVALTARATDSDGSRLPAAGPSAAALQRPRRCRRRSRTGSPACRRWPLDEQHGQGELLRRPARGGRGGRRARTAGCGRDRPRRPHARVGSDVGQRPPVLIGARAAVPGSPRCAFRSCAGRTSTRLRWQRWRCRSCCSTSASWSGACWRRAAARVSGWRCLTVAAGRAARPGAGQLGDGLAGRGAARGSGGGRRGDRRWSCCRSRAGFLSDVGVRIPGGRHEVLDGRLPYGNLPPGSWSTATPIRCSPISHMCRPRSSSPVRDGFDRLDGALYVATAFALLGALALGRAGRPARWRSHSSPSRP